jgi:dTDP-4-dehydrorhamnose 3,5-epimerase
MNEIPKKIYTEQFKDNRGFFREIFKVKNFEKKFIFDCYSKSKKNVFRGLHLQLKKQQAKFITVTKGEIIDFAIDVRKKSKNFGKIYKYKINENSNFSLYIPEGFAHGFLCLSESCIVYYKCSNYRDIKSEISINYEILRLKKKKLILSKKDFLAPKFKEIKHRFK